MPKRKQPQELAESDLERPRKLANTASEGITYFSASEWEESEREQPEVPPQPVAPQRPEVPPAQGQAPSQ